MLVLLHSWIWKRCSIPNFTSAPSQQVYQNPLLVRFSVFFSHLAFSPFPLSLLPLFLLSSFSLSLSLSLPLATVLRLIRPFLNSFVKVTDCVYCISPVVVVGIPDVKSLTVTKKMNIQLLHYIDTDTSCSFCEAERRDDCVGYFSNFHFRHFSGIWQNHGSSYILVISVLGRVLHCWFLFFLWSRD